MAATEGQIAEAARARSAAVLRSLKSYRQLTDEALGLRLGVSRSTVQGYVGGTSQLTIGLMYDFAAALDADPVVFLMEPDEALRWVIDNRPNGPIPEQRRRRSGWLGVTAA